jgi:transcription factor TFIIIB component B''
MDPTAPNRTPVVDAVVEPREKDTSAVTEPEIVSEPQPDVVVGEKEQAAAVSENTASTEADAEEQAVVEPEAPRSRKRRTLPWNAVNRPQEVVEEEAPVPAKKTRKPPKPRGKKTAANADETQEVEQQEGADGSEAPPVRKRLSAKARGKRGDDALDVEEGEGAPAPAKRARRTRKVKSKATVTDADADEDRVDPQAEEGQEAVARRKPRQPRKKKRTAPEDGQDESRPKRRGRPPREPTPSDAEDGEIDPDDTFMDSIASRNIRVGKLSNREKSMREIDWDDVRRKRREEDTRPINTKEEREKADQLLASQQSQTEMPQIRVGADGNIEMVHASTTIDRNALAEREMETMEVHEERDLTLRITSRSFLKNNKRFPNDFLLPGQGKKWTADDTELFYQGLRNFGTDFQMISHMFPTFTRVSIKHKFTREEKEHPDAVREALLGRSEIVDNWDDFMQVSQMTEERFADTDRIMREMAEEEARMRVLINAAKAEADKVKEQKKEAGLLDKDGNEIGGEKENVDGKGKKKRKGKEKAVTFQDESGVEIVGAVDEDATWGKE